LKADWKYQIGFEIRLEKFLEPNFINLAVSGSLFSGIGSREMG